MSSKYSLTKITAYVPASKGIYKDPKQRIEIDGNKAQAEIQAAEQKHVKKLAPRREPMIDKF